MTLWEILKANKTGIAPDMFTMLAASKMNGGRGRLHELSGIPPLSFTAKGKPLTAWSITGNTVQNGTPTPENPVEVLGCGERTANLFNGKIQQGGLTDSNGSLVDNMSTRIRTTKISISENTIYTISSNLIVRSVIAYKNGAFVKRAFDGSATGDTINSFTVPAGANQIAISFKGNKTGNIDITPDNLEYLMINEGSTALPYEPYGYKIPVVTSADGIEPITTPIYLPTPLYSGEVMRSDGTITRSDGTTETFTAPQIPTLNGTTVIDVDTAVKPESMTIKYRR